jgi:hypothetical protein
MGLPGPSGLQRPDIPRLRDVRAIEPRLDRQGYLKLASQAGVPARMNLGTGSNESRYRTKASYFRALLTSPTNRTHASRSANSRSVAS